MKKISFMIVGLVVIMAHSAKVDWDAKGKPQIEKSEKPIKGCTKKKTLKLNADGHLIIIIDKDNNTSSCND